MPTIIAVIEGFVGSVMVCVIAWLRHLSGASTGPRDSQVRYIVPVLLVIVAAVLIWMAIDEQHNAQGNGKAGLFVIQPFDQVTHRRD